MADNTNDPGRETENEGRELGQDKQQQTGQQSQQGETGQQRQNQELGAQQGETGQQGQNQEFGAQQGTPLGAGHQQRADGGSVTFAGSSSTGPGAGQAGIDRSEGFIGSKGDDSDPQQAGFAEQGRGAPDEGSDVERGGERSANRSTDIEGSSDS